MCQCVWKQNFTTSSFVLKSDSSSPRTGGKNNCLLLKNNALNDEDEEVAFPFHSSIRNKKQQGLGSHRKSSLRINHPPPIPNNEAFSRTMQLHRPVGIISIRQHDDSTYQRVNSYRYQTQLQISTGLTFDDGDQLLVSAQKPLGMILEERDERGCIVVSIDEGGSAFKAGVKEGDLLVAVQNADVGRAGLEEVMGRIIDAPRVVNLRFWRRER